MTLVLDRPEPIVDEATRRQFLGGLLAMSLLTSCADDETDGDASPATSAAPTTRPVTNAYGTFDIPINPQRVIGLEGRRDLETAIALQLGVVGVGSNAFEDGKPAPFLVDQTDFDFDSVTVIEQTEPSVEAMIALNPDLILTRGSNIDDLKDRLVRVAPLVPVDPDGVIEWREDLEQTARTLGRGDVLTEPLAKYDAKLAGIKTKHADKIANATVAVVQYMEATYYSSSTSGFYLQAQVLRDLGSRYLDFLQTLKGKNPDESFGVERTSELEPADAILVIVNTQEERDQLEDTELWQRLPAVEAGRVVWTDSRTNYGSIYAATAVLDLWDEAYSLLGDGPASSSPAPTSD